MIFPSAPRVVLIDEVMLAWARFKVLRSRRNLENDNVGFFVVDGVSFCRDNMLCVDVDVAVNPTNNPNKSIKGPDGNGGPEIGVERKRTIILSMTEND